MQYVYRRSGNDRFKPNHARVSGNVLGRTPSRTAGLTHRPRASKKRSFGNYIDPARFVNKAITTEEVAVFRPEHQFEDFAIAEGLKRAIATKGLTLPTPIQDRAIPHILRGEDLVGIAETGTGKTAAFLIPLINRAIEDKHARALILVPTRELAIQIQEELRSLSRGLSMYSACCVGGAGIIPQIRDVRRDPHFVIGTPGRLKDLIERGVLDLSGFNAVVLDEADRMLDMGFVNDMRFLLGLMPRERLSLCFSATMSPEIDRLVGDFLRTPVKISVKTRDTSRDVEQDVVRIGAGQSKVDVLQELLMQPEFEKVLVFGRTKHGVEKLANILARAGFKAESIHGNKTHGSRQQALGRFKTGVAKILVATDVAARGLDVPKVSHVINFDVPATHEDYVHRIGRTGRAGLRGKALTFIE
jgi:ATP-dependent RNA helicase RhlE